MDSQATPLYFYAKSLAVNRISVKMPGEGIGLAGGTYLSWRLKVGSPKDGPRLGQTLELQYMCLI